MADRVVKPGQNTAPDMPELLQKLLQYLVREARKNMEEQQGFSPFVGVAVGESLVLEEIAGEEPTDVYRMAKHTVEGTRGAQGYGFCYDGYVDTDEGQKDAIIAEGGMAGLPEGYAVALLYNVDQENKAFEFVPTISYIGPAPNFMALTFNDNTPDEEGATPQAQEPEGQEDADFDDEPRDPSDI